jgi:predicted phage-related endonuclease
MGLGIKRRRRGMVVAMVSFDEMIFYPIEADDVDIAKARQSAFDFWINHVAANVAPEAMTIADLDKLYKMEPGKSIEANDTVASYAMRLRAIDAQIDALGIEREHSEFEVKRAMQDAEMLVVDGRKIVTWKEQNTASLDQQALKRDDLAVWKKHYRRGKTRVFKSLKSAPAFEPGSAE